MLAFGRVGRLTSRHRHCTGAGIWQRDLEGCHGKYTISAPSSILSDRLAVGNTGMTGTQGPDRVPPQAGRTVLSVPGSSSGSLTSQVKVPCQFIRAGAAPEDRVSRRSGAGTPLLRKGTGKRMRGRTARRSCRLSPSRRRLPRFRASRGGTVGGSEQIANGLDRVRWSNNRPPSPTVSRGRRGEGRSRARRSSQRRTGRPLGQDMGRTRSTRRATLASSKITTQSTHARAANISARPSG